MQHWGIATLAAGMREAIRSNCSLSFTVVLTTLLSFRGFRVSGSLQYPVILELSAVACLQCWGDEKLLVEKL